MFSKHNEVLIINLEKTGKSEYFKANKNENISKCVKIDCSIVSRAIYSVKYIYWKGKRLKITNLRFHL